MIAVAPLVIDCAIVTITTVVGWTICAVLIGAVFTRWGPGGSR